MSAIPLPYQQNTPAWEEARRDSIGSSDIPIITGSHPYRSSRYELWAFKTRRIEALPIDEMTQELFDLGHALEPIIADRYTAITGRKVRRVSRMLRHPDIDWATASLDRVSARKGERLIVELKWDPWARFNRADEGIPPHVIEQVQWQLLVTGYEAADVAVLKGSHVEPLTIEPNPKMQDDLLFIARDFRDRYLVGGEPPAVDGSEATRLALARLYPTDDGTWTEPTAEMHALMRELADITPRLKELGDRDKTIRNALRSALGDHSGAEAPDWKVTHRMAQGRTTTDWRGVAAAYRTLLLSGSEPAPDMASTDALDAIEQLHTTTGEGSRRLLPTWKAAPADKEGDAWT